MMGVQRACPGQVSLESNQAWTGLAGAAEPLAIAEFVRRHKKVHVVICSDQASAMRLYESVRFLFSSADPVIANGTPLLDCFANARNDEMEVRNDEMEACNHVECLFFPDWETLPYDRFSPHPDLVSDRLYALSRLTQATHLLLFTTITTVMRKLCPPSFLMDSVWILKQGDAFNLEEMRLLLEKAGYHCTPRVMERGEFALRGGLVDVFPMGSEFPLRIEVFDEQIESIRTFDPDTQCTREKLDALRLLPAKEIPTDETARDLFRKKYRAQFSQHVSQSVIYQSVSEGQYLSGIEYYSPLFFEEMVDLFHYIPKDASVFLFDQLKEEGTRFERETAARYEAYRHDLTRPILPPQALFVSLEDCLATLRSRHTVICAEKALFSGATHVDFKMRLGPDLPIQRQQRAPLMHLSKYLEEREGWRILFIVESLGRREVILSFLKSIAVTPVIQTHWTAFLQDTAPYTMMVAPFDRGFEWEACQISMITEAQLFGLQAAPQRSGKQKIVDPDLVIRDLFELQVNAAVVHVDYGIGRYLGLTTIDLDGVSQEFMALAYAGGDKIYVPVTALHYVTRYSGVDAEHITLHKLGTDTWQREKKKAQDKIHDVAVELLEAYAKRQVKPALVMHQDEMAYAQFASEFPFEETIDQTKAIQAILDDLQSAMPMDRLVCGDVGFGKTEVAMRAAFVAVQSGKQVCVLVPTTLLAGQHFENFRDRFASFPIQIGVLSRFRSEKESQAVVKGLAAGTVDIVIGTHKLLMRELQFKDLGLMIIDEEHRFGVRQKERLKAIRHEVHCLTMTATPIPRTLNMAMLGMRDISLMYTPPQKRLSIKTFWREGSDPLIREAVLREILRGGQVFYLHNEVSTIENTTEALKKLLPEAQIRFAHGQMPERLLERLMSDFYHQRFNVLVCTTIIETGIDIPTANTIIIDRADLFGLAALHQLRGRVGRSHHQAYAYLLTPPEKRMTKDAVKRLEAIVSLEDLGAGFMLASQDLEIRGAGELLGEEQSGNMHQIGFQLYMELLERAVKALREHKEPDFFEKASYGCEVEVCFSALIPESYVHDVHERFMLYKRIATAKEERTLELLQIELIDRFGLLPASTKVLFQVTVLKLKATALGIKKIQFSKTEGRLHFDKAPQINSMVLIQLIQKESSQYRLQGPSCLRFQLPEVVPEKVIQLTLDLLTRLTP